MQRLATRRLITAGRLWASSPVVRSCQRPSVGVWASAAQQQRPMATAVPDAGPAQAQPPKVRVWTQDAEKSLLIALTVAGKARTLNRPQDEPLEKAFARLRANIAPKPQKAKKKRPQPEGTAAESGADSSVDVDSLQLSLYQDVACTRPIPATSPALEAWQQAQMLQVGAELFAVEFNPPSVEKCVVPRRPMVGFPILPRPKLVLADEDATQWRWLRRRPGSAGWEDTGCASALYTPGPDDVGCTLLLQVVPGARRAAAAADGAGSRELWQGETFVATSDPVEPAPPRFSAQVRSPPTPGPVTVPGAFRILSYNLLADQYAGSTYAQNVLFNYCPPANLDPDYRRQLILAELANYQADVLALQEVDDRLFAEFLVPHLARLGYEGHYTNKQGKVREGSATFWRTSRFRRMMTKEVLMRDIFKQPLSPEHAQWQPMLEHSPELVHALQKVTTIAQATVLLPVDDAHPSERPLVVCNTHLFYHPYAPHIRTMHTAAILEEVAALVQELGSGSAHGSSSSSSSGAAGALGAQPSVLFCGDLNSDLNDGIPGVVELLQSGKLPKSHWDWAMGANFRWGMGEEEGTEAQQAAAPQPPNSAIAAAVAAAKAASAAALEKEQQHQQQQAGAQQAAAQKEQQQVPSPERQASLASTVADDGHAFEQPADLQSQDLAKVIGIDVVSPYTLRSADDLATPFTNYTSGYKALLDYVWYQPEHLEVVGKAAVPTEVELGSYIPSPSFPSDHLAVVYDLRFK